MYIEVSSLAIATAGVALLASHCTVCVFDGASRISLLGYLGFNCCIMFMSLCIPKITVHDYSFQNKIGVSYSTYLSITSLPPSGVMDPYKPIYRSLNCGVYNLS